MEKYIPRIVIGAFILLALYGIINSVFLSQKPKLFTVGRIYEKSSPGKRGSTFYFKYFIDRKEYQGTTSGVYKFSTNKNGLIYIDVLKKDFTQYHVIEFKKVPECLDMDDVPDDGWDNLPEDSSICR
jgi:hypothetical protein